MFIVLLSFSESLATKFLSLNDASCMARPTLIDLNPVELKYYPLNSIVKGVMSYCQKFVFRKIHKKRHIDKFERHIKKT